MKEPTLEEIEEIKELSIASAQYLTNHGFYSCRNKEKELQRIDEIFEWIKSKLEETYEVVE